MTWPTGYGYDVGRRAVEWHEPVVAVLRRDLEASREKQQLELGREVDVAGEVGDETLGQHVLFEPVVQQAHVGALQMRLVSRGGAPQQPTLSPGRPSRGIDVEIHERACSHALSFGERRQVGHADIENEDAAGAEQAKRGGPGATPIDERQ